MFLIFFSLPQLFIPVPKPLGTFTIISLNSKQAVAESVGVPVFDFDTRAKFFLESVLTSILGLAKSAGEHPAPYYLPCAGCNFWFIPLTEQKGFIKAEYERASLTLK